MRLQLLVAFIFLSLKSFATHIRGGEITIKRKWANTCEVTLTGYVRTNIPTRFGEGGILDLGDGKTLYLNELDFEPTDDPTLGICQ